MCWGKGRGFERCTSVWKKLVTAGAVAGVSIYSSLSSMTIISGSDATPEVFTARAGRLWRAVVGGRGSFLPVSMRNNDGGPAEFVMLVETTSSSEEISITSVGNEGRRGLDFFGGSGIDSSSEDISITSREVDVDARG